MRRATLILAAAAALAMGPAATSALAADATGCSGSVSSLAADGTTLSAASAPGSGGTQADPLVIDPAGIVLWEGSTVEPITSGTWSVTIAGLPFRSGTLDNADGEVAAQGTVDLSGSPAVLGWLLQTKVVIPVSGSMTGDGGSCSASGYIAGTGSSPTSSPVFYAGIGFLAAGAVLAGGMVAGTKVATVGAAASGGAS